MHFMKMITSIIEGKYFASIWPDMDHIRVAGPRYPYAYYISKSNLRKYDMQMVL